MLHPFTISFIIPVFNNAQTLLKLEALLLQLCLQQQWTGEIIFVDDCSTDQSLNILTQLSSSATIIHFNKNLGQSTALLTGMQYAKGDVLVAMDADLQDRPDFIPTLVYHLNDTTDVAFSGRTGAYEQQSRLATAKIFKFLLHILSRKKLPANACLFFAIKQSAAQKITPYVGDNPYLLATIAKEKLRCTSVPYIREKNTSGQSGYTFKKRLKVGIKGITNFFFLQKKSLPTGYIEVIQRSNIIP
ncbi:MAG: glycosyltransferase [Ferruginibacter sp.]